MKRGFTFCLKISSSMTKKFRTYCLSIPYSIIKKCFTFCLKTSSSLIKKFRTYCWSIPYSVMKRGFTFCLKTSSSLIKKFRTCCWNVALKYIDQFAKRILSSPLLPYAAALIGISLFHQPLESFIHKFLVVHVFSKVESSPWKDVVVGIVLFLMLLFYVTKRKNYVVSRNITYAILAGAVIYGYYRFFAQVWSFTPWYCWEEVKYADVIFFLAGGNILLGWINRPSKALRKDNGTDAFIHDEPVGPDKEDVLGYSKYAEMLAEKIKASNFDKAFAIGVNGKWGSGKTSFINLLKGKLPKDDLLMIDFNPWNSQSPKAIIQDFFETVQEAIRPYHSSLARLLVQYADKLIALNDNQVAKSIQISIAAFTGHKSLNSLFKEINDALRRVNQKIVVFIDDLDRLDSEEIVEVIRLIRNTANFHHTFFVVTYDKGYVIQALQQHNSYHQEQFLEKIFQVEISLPYYRRDVPNSTLKCNTAVKIPRWGF
jgi:KAP family P-loop domain